MVTMNNEELESRAKVINDAIYGRTRKKKVSVSEAVNQHIRESMRFGLEKAFSIEGITKESAEALVQILGEENGSANILFAKENKSKAIEMITPLFGVKSSEFLETFQNSFEALQKALEQDAKTLSAS